MLFYSCHCQSISDGISACICSAGNAHAFMRLQHIFHTKKLWPVLNRVAGASTSVFHCPLPLADFSQQLSYLVLNLSGAEEKPAKRSDITVPFTDCSQQIHFHMSNGLDCETYGWHVLLEQRRVTARVILPKSGCSSWSDPPDSPTSAWFLLCPKSPQNLNNHAVELGCALFFLWW